MSHPCYDDFFSKFSKSSGSDLRNLIFSPYGIQSIFGMLLAGLGGSTYKELESALSIKNGSGAFSSLRGHFSGSIESLSHIKNEDLIIKVANKIVISNNFNVKSSFIDELKKTFHSSVDKMDFSDSSSVVSKINQWVSTNTHNKITNIIDNSSINADSKLVLLNAVYFKGLWETRFSISSTWPKKFSLANGNESVVEMMYVEDSFDYFEDDKELKCQAVSFKFDPRFSMIVLLPKTNSQTSLASLNQAISSRGNLKQLIDDKMKSETVKVHLPKFKVESILDLKDIFKNLGAVEIFENNSNFSGIVDSSNFYVSKAIHKAFLDIDELGAEGAAASGMICENLCGKFFMGEVKNFNADHPFIAIIYDKQLNIPIFSGFVYEPTVSDRPLE